MNAIVASVLSSLPSVAPRPIPRPDTLKGVDDLIRAGFEAYRGSCFNWLLAATGLVVVGLVFEGPELWHEITSIVRHWHFKRRFHFSIPEEHSPDWAKLLAFAGWLLIVIGVAGEYVADSFVSKADGYVQTFDEILLTEAQRRTAFASDRASAAYERAATTEREAAQENARAARAEQQAEEENARAAKALEAAETARKEAEGFQLQIAQANERAANAEKGAAEANLKYEEEHKARLLIEQRMADREITPDQRDAMLQVLRTFKPGKITVQSLNSEGREALTYANEIADAFTSAGWDVTRPDGMGASSVPQIGVILIGGNDDESQQLGNNVALALIAGKIRAAPVPFAKNPNKPKGDIEIWVGSKEVTIKSNLSAK